MQDKHTIKHPVALLYTSIKFCVRQIHLEQGEQFVPLSAGRTLL